MNSHGYSCTFRSSWRATCSHGRTTARGATWVECGGNGQCAILSHRHPSRAVRRRTLAGGAAGRGRCRALCADLFGRTEARVATRPVDCGVNGECAICPFSRSLPSRVVRRRRLAGAGPCTWSCDVCGVLRAYDGARSVSPGRLRWQWRVSLPILSTLASRALRRRRLGGTTPHGFKDESALLVSFLHPQRTFQLNMTVDKVNLVFSSFILS